ncbi:hypothetical protein COO60DRAFT_855739 [Scenedesmus sp. NREL 46B-D3]|nr:hypothetical protein COO60DRAFT_855739 [Scenedesmus sp. NREL 46B-D3]
MRLPLEQGAGLALGLDAWLNGSTIPLAVAAHPSGILLALARGSVLAVMPLLPAVTCTETHQAAAEAAAAVAEACSVHHSQHQYTALAWFAQLRPARCITPARRTPSPVQQQQPSATQHQQQAHPGTADNTQQYNSTQQHMQQQHRQQQLRCPMDAAEGLLEPAVLLSGTADGHLQIHGADGQLLFKQRFAATPVLDILVRPHCSGLCSSDAGEEVCVTYSNALVRISTLDLRSQVRMLQLAQGGGPASAVSIAPLPHTRYELPATVGPRVSGLSFGLLPADLYSLLSSAASSSSGSLVAGSSSSSRPPGKHKISIVTGVARGLE